MAPRTAEPGQEEPAGTAARGVWCSRHRDRPAGWRCQACATALCPLCAARGPAGVPLCASCGGLAQVLLVPRAEVLPFSRTWRPAAAQLLSWAGLAQLLVMAAALQLLFALPPRLWLLGRALELGWVLFLARRVGVGFPAFGRPRYADLGSIWAGPVPRALGGAFPVLGLAAWLASAGLGAASPASPWLWLVVGLAPLVLPAALVVASIEGRGSEVPWPWRLPRWTSRLGADLWPLALAVLAGAAAEALAAVQAPFDGQDVHLDLHIVLAFLPHLGSLAALAVAGCLAGQLVFTRASGLGHETAGSDLVPRLADLPQGLYVPVDQAAAARERARRFEPLELQDPESRLAAALEAGQGEAALRLLDGGVRTAGLSTPQRVVLAQLLAGRGEAARAADLLRLALRAGEARDPQAMVILARLCAERLGATAEALALYREVAAGPAGTPAVAFALAQLEALEGPLLEPDAGE